MSNSVETNDKKLTRRSMLFGGLRYAALAAMGAAGVATALKRRQLQREGECLNGGLCPQCGVFSECALPPARSLRGNSFSRRSLKKN